MRCIANHTHATDATPNHVAELGPAPSPSDVCLMSASSSSRSSSSMSSSSSSVRDTVTDKAWEMTHVARHEAHATPCLCRRAATNRLCQICKACFCMCIGGMALPLVAALHCTNNTASTTAAGHRSPLTFKQLCIIVSQLQVCGWPSLPIIALLFPILPVPFLFLFLFLIILALFRSP